MSYKIEGIIQEMWCDASGKMIGLKIKGSEGYMLKQGDKEYNVFCSGEMPQKEDSSSKNALIFNVDTMLSFTNSADSALLHVLAQVKCANRKICMMVNCDVGTTVDSIDFKNLKVESVAIL